MSTLTKEELREILDKHGKYIRGETSGERANLEGAYLDGANLTEANLREANLTRADLEGANLYGAYLAGANLVGANLRGANLRVADLRGAYLYGANLTEADLRGADLRDTEILSFSLGKHFAFLHISDKYPEGTYLKIGCEGHSLRHWQENYRQIGEKSGYGEESIEEHGIIINALAMILYKRKNKGDA